MFDNTCLPNTISNAENWNTLAYNCIEIKSTIKLLTDVEYMELMVVLSISAKYTTNIMNVMLTLEEPMALYTTRLYQKHKTVTR